MAAHTTLTDEIGIPRTSSLERAEFAERGLPLENLDALKARGLTFTEMANTVISPRTLKHRRSRGENLSSEETDRAIRVASVVELAEKIFGDPEKALGWLRYPNSRLNDRTPLSLLQTESGGRLIESMLWGINEGIFS